MPGSVGQYTQGWFPWVGHKSAVGIPVRTIDSGALSMGYLDVPNALNNEAVWPLYLDSVTWKVAAVTHKDPNNAISTFIFDGTTIGTIDNYAAAGTLNNYSEIIGFANATAKAGDLTARAATKNASSSGYRQVLQSIAPIRTGGTPSTPAGTDTPGYTWEWIPWMGSKANTSWDTRRQTSVEFSGGTLGSSVQNAAVSTDWHADTGTHKVSCIHFEHPNYGIITFKRGSTTLGTIDSYNAASTANSYDEITGITIATAGTDTFEMSVPTKNASAGGYAQDVNSVKWIRTGA